MFFIKGDRKLATQSKKARDIEDIYLSNKMKEFLESNKNTVFYIVARREKYRIDNIVNHNNFKAKTIDGFPVPGVKVKVIKNE